MHRWISCALIVLGCLMLPVLAQDGDTKKGDKAEKAPAPPPGKRVFYASHSLMWYVPDALGELAAAAGIKDHKLAGLQKIGASRTLQHWNLPDAENQAKKALKTGAVDVLVMSPIQFPDAGIENFVKLGLQHNPNMRFVVQLSWGGGDTDNQDFPKGAWDIVDKNKTPDQLKKLFLRSIQAGEAQADALNRKYGGGNRMLSLVPTAQALVALRTRIFNKQIPGLNSQGELFVDAAHPSPPLEALNTYLHYAVLYGQSPVGLPMPDALKNAKREEWDEKFNRSLQEIAWETVISYPYSGVVVAKKK